MSVSQFKIQRKPGVSKLPLKKGKKFSPPPPPDAKEKAEAEAATSTSVPRETEEQLRSVMRRQALTDQDRFEVLDARDKWFRLRGLDKVFSRSLSSGGSRLRGLCPDICPEKERYSRAAKNQLRLYEKSDPGSLSAVDPRAAVKEYSR